MDRTVANDRAELPANATRRGRWVIDIVLVILFCALLWGLLAPACVYPPEATRRRECKENLKQIGLALHNYHDKYACFPPAFIADARGRPMHSWRVLLLPFLGKSDLYGQYRLDEPWDGPNNRRLHQTIVPVFNCPSETHALPDRASTSTNYVAIVGSETAWAGEACGSFSKIQDGTSMTLLVVEVANSGIHWMEPRDLHVVQMAATINSISGQGIASRHEGGAHCLFADGTVRYLRNDIPEWKLRALITADAGDSPGDF